MEDKVAVKMLLLKQFVAFIRMRQSKHRLMNVDSADY